MQSLLILFHKSHGAKRRHLYHIEQASVRLPPRPLLDFPARRLDWIYSHRKNARRQISLRALAPQYGQSIGGSHLYFLQAKYPAPSLHENHGFCPPSKRLKCRHLRPPPKHHRFQQSDRPVWSSQRPLWWPLSLAKRRKTHYRLDWRRASPLQYNPPPDRQAPAQSLPFLRWKIEPLGFVAHRAASCRKCKVFQSSSRCPEFLYLDTLCV